MRNELLIGQPWKCQVRSDHHCDSGYLQDFGREHDSDAFGCLSKSTCNR